MKNTDIEKAKNFKLTQIIEYVPNSVIVKTIIKKATGNVSVISVDTGTILNETVLPFDTFIQIIDGRAEVVIDGISTTLDAGESIIVPAHSPNTVKANERFKMISTLIKSGYE